MRPLDGRSYVLNFGHVQALVLWSLVSAVIRKKYVCARVSSDDDWAGLSFNSTLYIGSCCNSRNVVNLNPIGAFT